jgi:putative transposase
MQIWYSDEKVAAAARQAEAGVPVAEIVRKLDISEATLYLWKKRFDRVETPKIDGLGQLRDEMRDENARDTKRLDPPAQTRYSDEQIAAAVRQAEAGVPVAEIVLKLGISEATLYVWVKRFVRFQTPEICELRQLRDENAQLRRLVADLARDRKACKTCSERCTNTTADCPPSGSGFSTIPQGADEPRNLVHGRSQLYSIQRSARVE